MNKFSYSIISVADSCRRKYKHQFIDQLITEEPTSINLSFGSAMHAGIEGLLKHGSYGPFKSLMGSISDPKAEELTEKGLRLLNNFQNNHAQDFKIFQMEERLSLEEQGLVIEGTPDFLGEYKGVPSVVDFKTSSMRYTEDKLYASDQLILYAEMARKLLQYQVKQIVYVVFVKVKDPYIQVLTLSLDEIDVNTRFDNFIHKCIELSQATNFTQNFASCNLYGQRCPYWDICMSKNKR